MDLRGWFQRNFRRIMWVLLALLLVLVGVTLYLKVFKQKEARAPTPPPAAKSAPAKNVPDTSRPQMDTSPEPRRGRRG